MQVGIMTFRLDIFKNFIWFAALLFGRLKYLKTQYSIYVVSVVLTKIRHKIFVAGSCRGTQFTMHKPIWTLTPV